ncbi:proteolipid membrane potential modulator [Klebsormidium nitens]|uniref:Proteolipid membrane potential modulator n=1 Tax=Klebsormidium nitens TaxID=105231 RepID=A0A1Y1I7L2_KLENI|nr:proteolipid membrane potential modulator [Klebsormidium nitens]|eukprot:GAQ86955.1 proteolipid membrane potential modulator [Klebsormidium nitens]
MSDYQPFLERRQRDDGNLCCQVLLAIICPPIGVYLRYGCGIEFWICILLSILGYVPGIIYSVYILTVNNY